MISVSFEMFFNSVFFSMLFGAVSGMAYTLIKAIFLPLKRLYNRSDQVKKETYCKCGILQNLFDFTFTVILELVWLIMQYVLMDGALEIYSILSFILFFFIFNRIFSKLFGVHKEFYC